MNEVTQSYLEIFKKELDAINTLSETPEMMRRLAKSAFESALKENISFSVKKILENSKTLLVNIESSSIKDNYKIIYNQMLILAVSSLEATIKKYFSNRFLEINNITLSNKKLDEIKISARDLLENNLNYKEKFGELILERESNSFQNLKQIKETFKNYFEEKINLELLIEKEIIYYLELRHVLVHKMGLIDEHFIGATGKMDSNLGNYRLGDKVQLNDSDWVKIKTSFIKLIEEVVKN